MERTYTELSMSLFQSMKIDIFSVTQAQFYTSANIPLTDDLKKYANQTKIVNSKV